MKHETFCMQTRPQGVFFRSVHIWFLHRKELSKQRLLEHRPGIKQHQARFWTRQQTTPQAFLHRRISAQDDLWDHFSVCQMLADGFQSNSIRHRCGEALAVWLFFHCSPWWTCSSSLSFRETFEEPLGFLVLACFELQLSSLCQASDLHPWTCVPRRRRFSPWTCICWGSASSQSVKLSPGLSWGWHHVILQ